MQSINELTKTIIGCAYEVGNTLGSGFLERVYENALAIELRAHGLQIAQQVPFKIKYKDAIVGDYFADLIVENRVIVEIKSVRALDKAHIAQCINYLTAAELNLALLFNFDKSRVEVRRIARNL
ncbi:MAG: GxxExxY protein [Anaerolineales bacterium]|nr:MAG: GxxExxY protein [Anaerolineales bacterium]